MYHRNSFLHNQYGQSIRYPDHGLSSLPYHGHRSQLWTSYPPQYLQLRHPYTHRVDRPFDDPGYDNHEVGEEEPLLRRRRAPTDSHRQYGYFEYPIGPPDEHYGFIDSKSRLFSGIPSRMIPYDYKRQYYASVNPITEVRPPRDSPALMRRHVRHRKPHNNITSSEDSLHSHEDSNRSSRLNPEVSLISVTAAVLRLDHRLTELEDLCALLPDDVVSADPNENDYRARSHRGTATAPSLPPPPQTLAAAREALSSFTTVRSALDSIKHLRHERHGPRVPGAVEGVAERLVAATKALRKDVEELDREHEGLQSVADKGVRWARDALRRMEREGKREWIYVETAGTLARELGEGGRGEERTEEIRRLRERAGARDGYDGRDGEARSENGRENGEGF